MNGNALARLSAQPVSELQARADRLAEQARAARTRPAQGISSALRMTKAAIARALELQATGAAKGHAEKPNKQRYADPFPQLSHGAEIQNLHNGMFVLSVYRPDNSSPAQVSVSTSSRTARREFQGNVFKTLQGAINACNVYVQKNGASADRPLQSPDREVDYVYARSPRGKADETEAALRNLPKFGPGELRGSDFRDGGRGRVTHYPVRSWDEWF